MPTVPPGAVTPPWSQSDRLVPRAIVRPALRFMQLEAAGGIVMLLAAVAALVWANSPWSAGYETLWGTHLDVALGDLLHFELTLRDWVNDAAMAVFFFVVGLEIKRELVVGELRDPRAAGLPAIAALGGMVVPALIYVAFNSSGEEAGGWGIPMATDIAFAAGVVSVLGRRVPSGAKLFLLTLAIVDDLGAIAVIALFYTDDLSLGWLGAAVGSIVAAALMRRVEMRSLVPYAVLAVACWVALHESGIHATIAGVAFGFLTPVASFREPLSFARPARRIIDEVELAGHEPDRHDRRAAVEERLRHLTRLAAETMTPHSRLEHRLTPWVSFLVVPVFALANAGVDLGGGVLIDAAGDSVTLGVGLGLLLGKPVGVFAATWLAVRLGLGRLPRGTTNVHLLGLAVCAGIGFTVALFVTGLSFDRPDLTDAAKVGILVGSLVAGAAGYLILRSAPAAPEVAAAEERQTAPS